MPMFLAGSENHNVTGANVLARAALALGAAAPGRDDEDLTERVRMPSRARAGFKSNRIAGRPRRSIRWKEWIDADHPRKIFRWPFGRGARTRSLDVHGSSLNGEPALRR